MEFEIEIKEKLEKFQEMVLLANQRMNLIGKSTEKDVWERHIIDSYQLMKYLNKEDIVLDFGAGAGFPGIVLSICGIKNVYLVESIAKKCSFLQEVVDEITLPAKVLNERVENLKIVIDVIVARAVAPLDKIFSLTFSKKNKAVKYVLLKGKNYSIELDEAKKNWNFIYKSHKSITSCESVILEIENLSKK